MGEIEEGLLVCVLFREKSHSTLFLLFFFHFIFFFFYLQLLLTCIHLSCLSIPQCSSHFNLYHTLHTRIIQPTRPKGPLQRPNPLKLPLPQNNDPLAPVCDLSGSSTPKEGKDTTNEPLVSPSPDPVELYTGDEQVK
jgi:hypothetical protein